MFITFEGCEGTGKSTQAGLLSTYLESLGKKVCLTREPGGTALGQNFRQIILNPENQRLVTRAELFLYFADRAQHVEELILPKLEEGIIVISDRYSDATYAYQGGGRGIELDLLRQLNEYACYKLVPDITILLDIDASTGLLRARKNRKEFNEENGDRIEQQTLDFHERVRKVYLELASAEPDRFLIVDANGTIEDVHARIIEKFTNWSGLEL